MDSPLERKPRVIVVDDHANILVALSRMLQQFCDVVSSVSNGRDAVEEVARLRPDILLADLMMPEMDGLEVCRRVKEQTPETAVIIVTAFDDAYMRSVAIERGASAFIPKHSAAELLERTILRVFAERRHHPANERACEAKPPLT
jgi:DNA-binding NarL/FixJ family response regulator